eukprot:PITA_09452
MRDYRPMATPMITNWKKIDASEDKEVDPTLYRSSLGHLCIWSTLGQTFVLLSTLLVSSWWNQKGCIGQQQGTFLDWAANLVDRKSTSAYCFNVGSGMISWCSRKQKSVAPSSTEVEYMVASTATCKAIWLRKLLVSLFRKRMEATKVYCNNQSCINLSENPIFHDRSKHIDIRCHFIKGCVQRGVVQLQYVPTGEQVADILTKALGRAKFTQFREQMGMVENPFK